MTTVLEDPTKPAPVVMTGAQWSAAQSAPASALRSGDPEKATTNGLGRVLTGEEYAQAQRMTADQVRSWKIPALPKITAAPRDATRGQFDEKPGGKALAPFDIKDPTTYANPILRQVVDPMLSHPLASIATLAAPFALPPAAGIIAGLGIAGEGVYHIAQYGWQKAAELSLDPETRKLAEKDPARISGEAASVQAIMLGLAPLVHTAVKGVDLGKGMVEAGVAGLESEGAPNFRPGYNDAHKNADFAASLEAGARVPVSGDVRAPKGFEPTAVAPARAKAVPPEGLIVPETPKAGRVKAVETQPASAGLQAAADVNASVREYQAQRAEQDLADIAAERQAAAERLLGLREEDAARVGRQAPLVRRRPGAQTPAGTPYFESPQGANLLGSMAARRGLSEEASPYPPSSQLDVEWKAGHDAVTSGVEPSTAPTRYESYPDGFSMGGTLTESRIPEIPERAGRPLSSIGKAPGQYVDRATEAALLEQPKPPEGFEPTAKPAPPSSRVPRPSQTLSDDPRYETGARRPLHLVTVKGLVKELVDLEDKRVDAASRAQYNFVQDENFHSTEDGRSVPVATRIGGRGVSQQAKALQNLEDYARIDQEVTQHLIEQRGIPEDVLNDLLMREREARGELAGGEAGDTSFDFGGGAQTPPGSRESPGGLTEVQGTGPARTRGLSSGVAQKALANRLELGVKDLPGYNRVSMAEQAAQATRLLADDPELALRVARGEAPAPNGLLPESVFVAVEQRAIEAGDVNTLRDLATGKLTSEATTMGQRIRALGERDPDSPVAAIQDVINTRSGGAKNSETLARAIANEVDAIDQHLVGVSVDEGAFSKLIDALTC